MMRKIASNYIFLPDYPLVKNGYVVWEDGRVVDVVDTGGMVREIQGLEFYGGMIVPGYVSEHWSLWGENDAMVPFLEFLYAGKGSRYQRLAIIEGADLVRLQWGDKARIRLL